MYFSGKYDVQDKSIIIRFLVLSRMFKIHDFLLQTGNFAKWSWKEKYTLARIEETWAITLHFVFNAITLNQLGTMPLFQFRIELRERRKNYFSKWIKIGMKIEPELNFCLFRFKGRNRRVVQCLRMHCPRKKASLQMQILFPILLTICAMTFMPSLSFLA